MRAWQRVRQFFYALTAPAPAPPAELAAGLRELYLQMPAADRAHGLRTYRRLAADGVPAELLVAALLHDAGKSRPELRLWHRVAFVLARRLAPGWLARSSAGSGWRQGLAALNEHAAAGARQVAEAGAPALVVRLVREHHTPPAELPWPEGERELLRALQAADEAE
jgi:hypothetical protein